MGALDQVLHVLDQEAYDQAIKDRDNLRESVRNFIDKINQAYGLDSAEEALDDISEQIESFEEYVDSL